MMQVPNIRLAAPDEAAVLSALALRAKARWGCDPAELDRWRADLTVTPASIRHGHTFVAEERDGAIAGSCQLDLAPAPPEFAHVWVEPSRAGRGIGRTLVEHALARLASLGFGEAAIDSDPHAVGFYEALGARRVGSVPAPIGSEPSRVRPQLRLATRREASPDAGPAPAAPQDSR